MRYVYALIALVMVLGAVAAYAWRERSEARRVAVVESTRLAREQVEVQIKYRAAVGEAEVNGRGWPVEVDPAWFGESLPRNALVGERRPWLEVASINDYWRTDPADRVAMAEETAGFWYNPATGAVRARVASGMTDEEALELYNEVNGSRLESLFETFDEATPPEVRAEAERQREEARARRKKMSASEAALDRSNDPTQPRDARPAPKVNRSW